MQRRTFFGLGGIALAAGAMASANAAEPEAPDLGIVSVKDARFGAVGDVRTDDTKAIQAAADFCFGPPDSPHGTRDVQANRILYFPPGNYRTTAPIRFAKLHGARVMGAGRFVTKVNSTGSGPVFVTNGCGYSHFEGLLLHGSDKTAAVFDLNWDGTPGGPALQSNSFVEIMFMGGGTGIDIGADRFMGSENIFINCFWIYNAIAGLKTSNFNALQNTVVGGNMQACNMGVWVERGSVCVLESVGFQLSREWDIRVDNSANDTINVIGCRTESSNFVQLQNFVHASIVGCTQTEAGAAGYFLRPGGCPVTVDRCVSIQGRIALRSDARLSVRGSSFGRRDWLEYGALRPGAAIEIEDVQIGGTPNLDRSGSASRIARQRITADGVHEYVVRPV